MTMAAGKHQQPVMGPPMKPGQRRSRTMRVDAADVRPGSRYRFWNPKTGKYGIFMAGASLRIYYTEKKGWMLAPPQPWAWYVNPDLLHSTGSNADMDRARAIDGPFPIGVIGNTERFNKVETTWEEFYKNRNLEVYAPYNENQAPPSEMTDSDVDTLVNKLEERGFKLVPIDGNEQEEGDDDEEIQHQHEPRDSDETSDGDVPEPESSRRKHFTAKN
jgi:hypothetical protein